MRDVGEHSHCTWKVIFAVSTANGKKGRKREEENVIKSRYKIKPTGRMPTHDHSKIKYLLEAGKSYNDIINEVGCSKNVINHVKKKFEMGYYGRRRNDSRFNM